MTPVPTRAAYLARWSDLHGGYDPRGAPLVHGWLSVVYVCARPFAALRVPPDLMTMLGLVVSGLVVWLAALGGRWVLGAVVLVVISGLVDGLDGAVAVLTDRVTRWGHVLDSAVDRCSDALYLVALWLVGAPAGVCVAAGAVSGLLEDTRARAGAGGMSEVGVVTVAERPTRVIITAAFLLGAGLYVSAAATWAALGAWAWLGISLVGLGQLLVVVRRRLSDTAPG
ncbi:MAG TPA: CDP-alcohol phosphatidyltransferase family protein [Candidatus Limnocylindria bacterium]|nr:CDP-alcohol phosphatidyltransferase family protein [Candidatus Limnocylindria bacterium]